jgi:hypothetical protein
MSPTARSWYVLPPLLTATLGAGCQRQARAQPAESASGPIECYEVVADLVASTTGVDLCTSATSAMPGECFVATSNRHSDLATDEMVTLCRGANSFQPLVCLEELEADGTLTNDQIIGYCAMQCPIGPAPAQSSSPACVQEGLDRTDLSAQMVGELCIASHSAAPVDCYLRGESATQLTTGQLVYLCAQRYSCQYVNYPQE